MKKLLILPILLLIASCYNAQRDSKNFKTGKFEFTQEINGVKKTSTFERTDKIQIETFDGRTDTASIRWVNDYEYILKKIHPKNMQEKKSIALKILTTTKNSYTFEFGIVGSEQKQKGTVTKIAD